jgi:hypothetical protein
MFYNNVILSTSDKERFSKRILYHTYLDEGNGCWLWKGIKFTGSGYGSIRFLKKHKKIHRISYAVFNKDFDDNLDVLHTCDVPACCNPEHLFLGTQIDNINDAVSKGRHTNGITHPQFGKINEEAAIFKITDEQRRDMFYMEEEGLTHESISEITDISKGHVDCILSGRFASRVYKKFHNKDPEPKNNPPTSKYIGVSWHKVMSKWRARIMFKGKDYMLGYFITEEDGARAYNKKALELLGEFAKLNKFEEVV